jgi:UDP:flavonoid glycosyltransferase YjiC (YdhE family)
MPRYLIEHVVAAGAAVQLMPDRLTADSAREAVRMLLSDDTFERAAHRIKNELDAMPDARQAVEMLEQLVSREPLRKEAAPLA